jgi:general stress protein 26
MFCNLSIKQKIMARKDFDNKKAIKKLRKLAERAKICMMTTQLDRRPASARPMSLQQVDDQGVLWFISGKDSDQNYDLQKDAETQLFFMNNKRSEYLSVYGTAEIYTDKIMVDEHWSEMAKAWFEEGKEDPNVSIIGIRPIDVKYWGTKHGKFVDMALMLYSAVTDGNTGKEGGIKGELKIQ